jgi:S1-C subfamily serine protease
MNGREVETTDDVQAELASDAVGKPIKAELLRGGSPVALEIVPAERPKEER